MASKGEKKQLKRIASPVSWPTQRKDSTWITRPSPGPHAADRSLPLRTVMRDVLHLADNAREASRIIKSGNVQVDGRVVKDEKLGVGLMDIVSIPEAKADYMVLYTEKGKLALSPIDAKDAKEKLCRVKHKTRVRGGKTQITLHDGKNIVVKKDEYKTGDSVKISIPKHEIKEHYPMQKGYLALIRGGKHSGSTGKIEGVQPGTANKEVIVQIKTDDALLLTPKSYVFVIGKDKPAIKTGR